MDHDRVLDEWERYRRSEVCVAAALHYCAQNEVSPPQWLTVAASHLICELLKRERPTESGRTAGIVNRLRQDLIHWERHDLVSYVREKQQETREEYETLRKMPRIPKEVVNQA